MKALHTRTLKRFRVAARDLSLAEAADAFLASLSTRNLAWRRPLDAVLIARLMPEHECVKPRGRSHDAPNVICGICGLEKAATNKWSLEPRFLTEVLEGLGAARPRPNSEDLAIFNKMLRAVSAQKRMMAVDQKARRFELMKALSPVVPSNKMDRFTLLEMLGRCEVLNSPKAPGFLRRFVPWADRRKPEYSTGDFQWPFCWWTASDGFDVDAVKFLFPHAAIDLSPTVPQAGAQFDAVAEKKKMENVGYSLCREQVKRVLFAPGALWIALLQDGHFGLLFKVARRWRWVTGSRDDVLACVPDPLFADAVAVLNGVTDDAAESKRLP